MPAALDRDQRRAVAELRDQHRRAAPRLANGSRVPCDEDHGHARCGTGARRGSARACPAGAADTRGTPGRRPASRRRPPSRRSARRATCRPPTPARPSRARSPRRTRPATPPPAYGARVGRAPAASMYGKLKRSVATLRPFIARANPTMNGWSMPAPAPWRDARAWRPDPRAARTRPRRGPARVLDRRAVPQVPSRVPSCHRERQLLPGHVGVRLRRVEARRLLSRGPEEARDARLLLVAALVGRDQLHVPPVPDREVAHARGASKRSRGSCSR